MLVAFAFLGLVVTGKVGIGTFVTVGALLITAVWASRRFSQGDPSEWRENYLGEVTRRQEVETELIETKKLLVAAAARTDLEPLMEVISGLAAAQRASEERMTKRLDAFEKTHERFATILANLVEKSSV